MFEKEAEEYINKLTKDWSDGEYSFSVEELRQAIHYFAEFGYNIGKEEQKHNTHTVAHLSSCISDVQEKKIEKAKEIITALLNVFVYDLADDEMDTGHIDTKIKAEQFLKEIE